MVGIVHGLCRTHCRAHQTRLLLLACCTPAQVAEADIARVISDWTGIPLTKLVETEADKVRTRVCTGMKTHSEMPSIRPSMACQTKQWFCKCIDEVES
jgi:hypothetical protein